MSTARQIRPKPHQLTGIFAGRTWCPRQDLNLRSRLRRPGKTLIILVYGILSLPFTVLYVS